MQLMDQALLAAIHAREVDPDRAYEYALDKKPFQRFITDTSVLPQSTPQEQPAAAPPPSPPRQPQLHAPPAYKQDNEAGRT